MDEGNITNYKILFWYLWVDLMMHLGPVWMEETFQILT
jgi:hypothetical protein